MRFYCIEACHVSTGRRMFFAGFFPDRNIRLAETVENAVIVSHSRFFCEKMASILNKQEKHEGGGAEVIFRYSLREFTL